MSVMNPTQKRGLHGSSLLHVQVSNQVSMTCLVQVPVLGVIQIRRWDMNVSRANLDQLE